MNITLFTPLLLEQQAVLPFLENSAERILDSHLYIQGDFQGKHQKFNITVVVTGSNNSLISNVVERSLSQFPSSMAILLGIAGGVKDVGIGDVVIGTKSYGYESGKEKASGFVVRPQVFPASQDLISLAQLVHHQNQWHKRIKINYVSPNAAKPLP